MRLSNEQSIRLSKVCVWLFMILLAALDLGCYWAVDWFIGTRPVLLGFGLREGLLMMSTIYLGSAPAWVLLINLHRLLGALAVGQIFVPANVARLRRVSWCCTAACLLCLISAFYYLPWLLVAVAAGFMALIVRIVKNCFAQAAAMKDELDFTI